MVQLLLVLPDSGYSPGGGGDRRKQVTGGFVFIREWVCLAGMNETLGEVGENCSRVYFTVLSLLSL